MRQDYSTHLVSDPATVDAAEWDALLATQGAPTPFMRHAFLSALVACGCATARRGWAPAWVLLRDTSDALAAAAPAWIKSHSRGEYVFDFAWADAYEHHGLPYYPKLTVAVPFTPVPGSRLLARDEKARQALVQALRGLAIEAGCSSAHLLFATADELQACSDAHWLRRDGLQFHWRNREPQPYADFGDFLAGLKRDKRKKILQERRRVSESGVAIDVREGQAIRADDWSYFGRAYAQTYFEHGNPPYLNQAFFERISHTLSQHWLMVLARTASGQRIAASLLAIDRAQGVAWGRYWGATAHLPLLHFELCYYTPLVWCIAQRFSRFEGGAQGEHKLARGFDPAPTGSAHWLAHPAFADAVAVFLARERAGISDYISELHEHRALRSDRIICP